MRDIQQKQAWAKDVFEENNEVPLSFVGRFSLNDNPAIVANDIINTLQVYPPKYSIDSPDKRVD